MEMSVGQVAKRAGINVSALHFYKQKGLIHSWRNQGNQRRYHRSILRRIAVIKAAQEVGLSLDDIRDYFDLLPKHRAPSREQWDQMAAGWKELLAHKIRQMEAYVQEPLCAFACKNTAKITAGSSVQRWCCRRCR